MVKISEIVLAWQWSDGTRCVLCDAGGDKLELRVTRNGQTLRREPVHDVLAALRSAAPVLELELSNERMRRRGKSTSVTSPVGLVDVSTDG